MIISRLNVGVLFFIEIGKIIVILKQIYIQNLESNNLKTKNSNKNITYS